MNIFQQSCPFKYMQAFRDTVSKIQCFTWWYLPILTWECLRIMPSLGRSYKQKEKDTLRCCRGHTLGERGYVLLSYLSHQQLQQCGLPRSIRAHQSHSSIQVDTKLQVFINVRLEGKRTGVRLKNTRSCDFRTIHAAAFAPLTVLSLYLKLTFWTMITGGGIFPQGGK